MIDFGQWMSSTGTQASWVATVVGVSEVTVRRWMNGGDVSANHLDPLVAAIEVRHEHLRSALLETHNVIAAIRDRRVYGVGGE